MPEESPPKPATRLDPTAAADADSPGEPAVHRRLLATIRYGLPAAIVLGGIVVMAMGSESDLEGGASIVGAGIAVYFLNWLFRIGSAGDSEREAEDAAREHFDRYGRWPS